MNRPTLGVTSSLPGAQVPPGTTGNSPPFQRGEPIPRGALVPHGTAESLAPPACRPSRDCGAGNAAVPPLKRGAIPGRPSGTALLGRAPAAVGCARTNNAGRALAGMGLASADTPRPWGAAFRAPLGGLVVALLAWASPALRPNAAPLRRRLRRHLRIARPGRRQRGLGVHHLPDAGKSRRPDHRAGRLRSLHI